MTLINENGSAQVRYQPLDESNEFDEVVSIKEVLTILERHKKIIVLMTILGLLLGAGYVFMTPPRYTATTSILIDPRQSDPYPDLFSHGMSFQETLSIDSQIQVILSHELLAKAAERAGIFDDITLPTPSIWETITGYFTGEDPNKETIDKFAIEKLKNRKFAGFRSGLKVERVGKTYVIDISYTSRNPEHAAKMANLITEVYLDDELEAQYESTQRSNKWLEQRIQKLRKELSEAERAVEDYKEKNDIIEAGGKLLISDQQLSELNRNMIVARTESAQAKARHERITKMIKSGNVDLMSGGDSLNSSVVNSLRKEYIELSRLSTGILRKQGSDHEAYRNLRRQMADIQNLILGEYRRIAEGYKNDYEIAKSKQEALEKELDAVKSVTRVNQVNQIELRELERRAESTRQIYEKMLDKYNEQAESQSVPVVHARIISRASTPLRHSWPNTRTIMMISLILGLGAGVGFALLREQLDKYIWKAEELEAATRRTCLGMLPRSDFDQKRVRRSPVTDRVEVNTDHIPEDDGEDIHADPSLGRFNKEIFQEISKSVDKQTGLATEIMRNIQLAVQSNIYVDTPGKARVLSFVSARPGEGKSITSCFLAKHLSKTGARVVLVDCDFRKPSLTNWFIPNARKGFYELASQITKQDNEKTVSEISSVCFRASQDKLYFIPAKGIHTNITNLNLVASGQMNMMINYLKQIFDVVLIDLPPIINIVDARVIANSVDSFVFLAHWGKTDREMVNKALKRAPEVYDKTVGALLTMVEQDKASRYGYGYYHYYNSYYYR
jgi:succinoglycan biosynthesis transport protein ExoP